MIKFTPHFFLFLTIIFWGSSFPLITYSLNALSPMELAFSRFFLPASLSFIYICFSKAVIMKGDIINFIIVGIFGIFGFALFINLGQKTLSAGAGSFIVNCNPLITSMIGYFFLKQKIKRYFWLAILICFIGIFIISFENYKEYNFDIGTIYLLIAALLISFYFHLIKPLVNKYGALTTFSYTIIFGTLPMIAWSQDTYKSFLDINVEFQLSVIWLTLMATLIPYYTWTYSVGYFGANKASFFLFLIPLVSIFVDLIIFNNLPNIYTLIGGVLIISSVLGVLFKNYKEDLNKKD